MTTDVEKVAKALDDAIDNALIAWGMGWDMDGVMACLKEAKDAAALAAAEAETQPVAWQFAAGQTVEKFTGEAIWHGVIVARYLTTKGKQRYVVEVQPQGFQMIAVPEQLRYASPRPEAVGEDWRAVDDAIWFYLGHENHKPEDSARLRRMSGVVLGLAGEENKG